MGPLERKRGNVTRRQAVIRPMCSPNVVADYHAVTDGIEERHSWRGNQFSTCMVLFEGYQFVESLKFIDLTRRIWFPMHARDTCKLYCILFARSKLDSIRRTGESYDPFLVHDLVFPFLPLFFSPEKRERERKIYQDSPLVSARRASLSARRYEEDVYDARRNFSLKLPTRYSSICAYQEVDNGVCYSERRGSLSTADFLSGAFDRRLSFVSHNKMGFNVRTKLENCSQQTCIYIYILGVFQLYVEVGEPCRLNRLWQAAASNCLWSRMHAYACATVQRNVVCPCLIRVRTPDAILIRLQSNPGFFNRCRSTFPCSATSRTTNKPV